MITRRIQVNLVVFALLGLVLGAWALRTVLKFDAFSRPYQISAQFAGSPGLQPGFDVTYLGVAVGKIHSVRLGDRMVVVRFEIDKGRRIPRGVTAAAALKSAIGEPYVDLAPAAGQAGAAPMRPGEVIPLARTSVAESYGDLFGSVSEAVNGLDPESLRIVTRELALGLDGRGDSLRSTVDGASQLAGTFARNTGTLDGLITNLSTLTQVLADRRGDLATGITGTADLTASLAEVDHALVQIRDNAPNLAARSARLLRESDPALRCLLGSLGTALPVLLSDGNVVALDKGLRWSPQLASAMKGVLTTVNGQPNLNLKFVITLGPNKTAVEYRELLPLPSIPRIPTCAGVKLPSKQVPPMTATKTTTKPDAEAAASGPAPQSEISPRNSAAGTHDDPMSWLVYLPPLVATLILLSVVVRALGLAWRPHLKRRGR